MNTLPSSETLVQKLVDALLPALGQMLKSMTLVGFVAEGDKVLRDALFQALCLVVQQAFGSATAPPQGDCRKPLVVHSALGTIPLFVWCKNDESGKPRLPSGLALLRHGCTVAVQEQVTALYALVPVAEVAFSMGLFLPGTPSPSTIHRVAVAESNDMIEEFSPEMLSTLLHEKVQPFAEQVGHISVGADGGHVPMKGEGQCAQREWHEGRVTTVTLLSAPDPEIPRNVTLFDEHGNKTQRVVGHERRILAKLVLGQMPTLQGPRSDRVERALKDTYHILSKLCPQATWQGVCDGGDWPEQIVDATVGTERRTTDWFHASSHLYEVAESLTETKEQAKTWWMNQYNALLTQPGESIRLAENLETLVREKADMDEKIKSAGYFIKRQGNMAYSERLAANEMIGSGNTEAGVKQEISVRMKRSGASWTHRGGEAVMHARGLILSGLWEGAWREHATGKRKALALAA